MTETARAGGGRRRVGLVLAAVGAALVIAGLAVFIPPLLGVLKRGHADQVLLHKWKDPGSALTKHISGSGGPVSAGSVCGAGTANSEYALVQFPSLPGIEGVAGNGNWSMLTQRSVVHYSASPGPGQPGNALIAMHREPNFEPLNTLQVGQSVVITNRNCQRFTYQVTNLWVENPNQVTQLQPLSGGAYLTLITCTPLWVDTQRLVIRAELVAQGAAQPANPAGSG